MEREWGQDKGALVGSINHGLGRFAGARESVSFSGKRNVSKTHNINSIRLFRVRKAQRRHCANASAVTSPELRANKWPHFLARTEGDVVGGRGREKGEGIRDK